MVREFPLTVLLLRDGGQQYSDEEGFDLLPLPAENTGRSRRY